ncbi:MAG TPA: cytochrome P450, partial [Pseudonocardiaceae bacterium]
MTETVSTGVAADAAKLAGRTRIAENTGAGTEDTFPGLRSCPFAPPAQYGRMREEPIVKVPLYGGGGQEAWWISRHEDARAVLNDRRFSSDRRKDAFPTLNDDPGTRERFKSQPPSMIGLDGAQHAEARRAVIGEFTVKRIAALQPRVQEIVDECIDKMLASENQPVDLVQALSLVVPSMVICEMLGVPYTDHDFFQSRTSALIRRSSTSAERANAFDELRGYMDELITAKETEPGDDLFSRQ